MCCCSAWFAFCWCVVVTEMCVLHHETTPGGLTWGCRCCAGASWLDFAWARLQDRGAKVVQRASFLFSFNNQSCKVCCCKVCPYCVQVLALKHESEEESGKRKRTVVHIGFVSWVALDTPIFYGNGRWNLIEHRDTCFSVLYLCRAFARVFPVKQRGLSGKDRSLN